MNVIHEARRSCRAHEWTIYEESRHVWAVEPTRDGA